MCKEQQLEYNNDKDKQRLTALDRAVVTCGSRRYIAVSIVSVLSVWQLLVWRFLGTHLSVGVSWTTSGDDGIERLLRPRRVNCEHMEQHNGELPEYRSVELIGSSTLSLPSNGANTRRHVLVTGGAGYIGSHAVLRLLEEGYAVTIVDNLSRGNVRTVRALQHFACDVGAVLQFAYIDLGDPVLVKALLKQTQPEFVIHFAAMAFVRESMNDPLLYFQNVTQNTLTLLKAMDDAKVSKLIYSSSCTTYGNLPAAAMPITENNEQHPTNNYGLSKLMAEQMIVSWVARQSRACASILRYFNVIGSDPQGRVGEIPKIDGNSPDTRISNALFDAASGRIDKFRVMGSDFRTKDGTAERDYIHVADLVDAHILVLQKEMASKIDRESCSGASIYNVGLGFPHSVKELISVGRQLPGALPFEVEIFGRRQGDPASLYANSSKIKALGWTPRFTNLTEALTTAWLFRRAHPELYPGSNLGPVKEQGHLRRWHKA